MRNMANIQNKDFNVQMQLRTIEILNSSLNLPVNPKIALTNFNFNISLECRADAGNKIVFVIVHVQIKNEDQSEILGSISVSCIFEVVNFQEVITVEEDGKLNIPPKLIETLNIISISTTRGVMFCTFKGTLLHSAVLPIIDPKQFNLGSI